MSSQIWPNPSGNEDSAALWASPRKTVSAPMERRRAAGRATSAAKVVLLSIGGSCQLFICWGNVSWMGGEEREVVAFHLLGWMKYCAPITGGRIINAPWAATQAPPADPSWFSFFPLSYHLSSSNSLLLTPPKWALLTLSSVSGQVIETEIAFPVIRDFSVRIEDLSVEQVVNFHLGLCPSLWNFPSLIWGKGDF